MTATQFLELLISLTLQSSVVIAVTYWLCRLVETPRVQCRLWNLCFVMLLMMCVMGALLPHLRMFHPWSGLAPSTVATLAMTEGVLGRGLLWLWGVGAALSLVLVIREWRRAIRFLETCQPLSATRFDATEAGQAANHLLELYGDNTLRVLVSDDIGSPFCCQWHRPQLVLPTYLQHCTAEELSYVIQHETEHLRSGHPLQLFLQRLVEAVFWFHPLVHWASQQSALAREFACDDAAVSSRQDVIVYLKLLLAIAERGQVRESEGALLFFGRSASMVAVRGRRLVEGLETGRPRARRSVEQLALAGVIGCALLLGLVWAPVDVMSSGRTTWSPWPTWSATVLHGFDIPARDYEPYEARTRGHELLEAANSRETTIRRH